MQRFLVAFAALDGQTDKIAHHIARKLEDARFLVRLIDVRSQETEAGADECDAVILAGTMYRRRFDPALPAFIQRHAEALRRCPSAFIPVGVSAAANEPDEKAAVDDLVRECGWTPDEIVPVAGAADDRSLNFFERTPLQVLFEPERETSTEPDPTDWSALDKFVRTFASRVAAAPSESPGRT